MRVRFWGTRGSIPVALDDGGHQPEAGPRCPRPPAAARHPGAHRAVRRARPRLRHRPTRSAATRPASRSMPGSPEYVLCDLGSGARELGNDALAAPEPRRARSSTSLCRTSTGTTSWGSRSSCPPTSRATASHLRLPRRARGGLPAPARRAVLPGGLLPAGAPDRVRPPRAREDLRYRGPPGHRQAAVPLRRFLRLPVRARRQDRRLLHRLRAQARRSRERPARSPSSSATRTW